MLYKTSTSKTTVSIDPCLCVECSHLSRLFVGSLLSIVFSAAQGKFCVYLLYWATGFLNWEIIEIVMSLYLLLAQASLVMNFTGMDLLQKNASHPNYCLLRSSRRSCSMTSFHLLCTVFDLGEAEDQEVCCNEENDQSKRSETVSASLL